MKKNTSWSGAYLAMLALLLSACSNEPVEPTLQLSIEQGLVQGEFVHAPVNEVLKMVSNKGRLKVSVFPGVEGDVNASFDKVKLDDAIKLMFKDYNFSVVYSDQKIPVELIIFNDGEENQATSVAKVIVPSIPMQAKPRVATNDGKSRMQVASEKRAQVSKTKIRLLEQEILQVSRKATSEAAKDKAAALHQEQLRLSKVLEHEKQNLKAMQSIDGRKMTVHNESRFGRHAQAAQ